MILIGHPLITNEKVFRVKSKDEVEHSPSNSTIIFENIERSVEIAYFCNNNNIKYGVITTSIKDAIFANALSARYIIVHKDDAQKIQDVANEYLFESKILCIINDDDEIEEIAAMGIDGVIFEASTVYKK